jgi:hypothetical protein
MLQGCAVASHKVIFSPRWILESRRRATNLLSLRRLIQPSRTSQALPTWTKVTHWDHSLPITGGLSSLANSSLLK